MMFDQGYIGNKRQSSFLDLDVLLLILLRSHYLKNDF